MKFIIIWAFMVLSCNSQAAISDNKKFCSDLVAMNSKETPKLSTLSVVKAIFFPSKIVFLDQERASNEKLVKAIGNNHIILNLMKTGDSEKVSTIKEELLLYKSIKNDIKKNAFAKEMVLIKSEAVCLELLDSRYQEYNDFLVLSEKLNEYKKYQSIFERVETQKYALKSIVKLLNRKWKVHNLLTAKNLDNVFKSNPEQIILITHATSEGVIIDSNNRVLPESTFKNTPTSLRKLSVFSCYSNELKQTYHINDLLSKDRFDFIYPIIQPKYEKVFQNTTPILGIKALALFHKNLIYMPKRKLEKKCWVKFGHNVSRFNLAVAINNNIVGLLTDREIAIYCDLLKNKNTITLIKTDKRKIEKEFIENELPRTFLIEEENKAIEYEFKHYFRDGMYSSSKSKSKERL
jgi:hypothetical protein